MNEEQKRALIESAPQSIRETLLDLDRRGLLDNGDLLAAVIAGADVLPAETPLSPLARAKELSMQEFGLTSEEYDEMASFFGG